MAYHLNILQLLLGVTVLCVGDPLRSYLVDVDIFLEKSSKMRNIAQKAIEYNQTDHGNISPENNIRLNLRLVTYDKVISRITNLDHDRFFNCNTRATLCAAIFVQFSGHEIFLSSLMEWSNIVTVGLFQTSGNPLSQESPVGFIRTASPSIQHYASVIKDVMNKMGWRTLSLVLSADYEGTVLAGEIIEYSKKAKWDILHTVWVLRSWENGTELESAFNEIMTNESDVVIVHMRDSHNDDIFQLFGNLDVKKKRSSWLLTDITTFGVSTVNLPTGFVRISPWASPNHDYMVHALYDAVSLIALSAARAVEMYGNSKTTYQSISNDSNALQSLFKRIARSTFLEGKTSIFENPSAHRGPFSVMDISSLEQDLTGIKHWTTIGLSTYSGIAMESFKAPNGQVLLPRLGPSRPILRVPVVLYPPWVEAEEPQETYEEELICLKQGYLCYNKTGTRVKTLCCFGFSIDLLEILERELHFSPEIYFVADGQYGIFDEKTGKWNGIIRELLSGEGDLSVDIALSQKRAKYIDFSFPHLPLAFNVLVQKEDRYGNGVQWYSWLKPFDVWLWLAILGTCNVILIVVWWFDRKSPTGHHHILREREEDGVTLLDAMSYVWGVAFGKDIGAEKTPRSLSARWVSTVYAFMALILVNTYSANLMANLLQEDYVLPIKGIKDPKLRDPSLHPPNGFKIGILQGTFAESYFKNNIDHELRQLYNGNLKVNLMTQSSEGINKLQEGEIQGLMGDYLSLRGAANKIPGCNYCLAGPNFYTHGVAFAVPKGSPWLDDVNRVVIEMKTNGSVSMIEKRYFDKMCSRTSAKNLSILNFSGLYLTVAIAIAACFLALIAEVIAIFVLVRFRKHLGVVGKFSMRLLFNLKRGEEHLITLKQSSIIMKEWNCVKIDIVRVENCSSNSTSVVESRCNSVNAANDLNNLHAGIDCQPPGDKDDVISNHERSIRNMNSPILKTWC